MFYYRYFIPIMYCIIVHPIWQPPLPLTLQQLYRLVKTKYIHLCTTILRYCFVFIALHTYGAWRASRLIRHTP